MQKAKLRPTLSYYNALLDMYCNIGRVKDALDIFDKLNEDRIEPDVISYTTLIKLYCSLGELGDAEEVLLNMQRKYKVRPGLRAYLLLLDAYGKVSVA